MLNNRLIFAFGCLLPAVASAQQATPTHIRTRWAADVTPDHVLPEYPRPQLVRRAWTSLNGLWDYQIASRDAMQSSGWDGKILVPFPVQSQLSGVERAVSDSERLWYGRSFRAPALKPGERLLLHFGAVDWQATVWVNQSMMCEHRGGYDPFTCDITDALRPTGDQELKIGVTDPTDRGPQPRGKQVLKPNGIWYTAVTGIWQTTWLEPVPAVHIDSLTITPDVDAGTVTVRVAVNGGPAATRVNATAMAGGQVVATVTGTSGTSLVLRLPNVRLWSPADPFLYELGVSLSNGDTVQSYFGMRKISVGHDSAGVARLFLNNRPLFEYGMLDQGWWPDGLYSAPSDDAMRYDIETMKHLGFNMIRKHVKVEPDRWYYLADRIGMLVWQDMPSGDNNTAAGKAEFEVELRHVVDALRNHPSIVMWVPFNEGWGQYETERIVTWLKGYDPTRLVNNASGWTDRKVGDVSDIHAYPGPGMPPLESARAAVLGEFGGLGLPIASHTWVDRNNWGYRSFTSQEALGAAYADLLGQLRMLIGDGLSAAVYTQTTDVEIEVNGLMTYDRAVVKLPADAIAAAAKLFAAPPKVRSALPTSQLTPQEWQYTTSAPADGWSGPGFDDAGWKRGPGGFGTDGTPGSVVRTQWNTADIWLRRTFTLPSAALVNPHWRIHHDEDADVYLNGELVARLGGYTAGYVRIPLDAHAIGLLRTGTNTIAIHVHQTTGGQYIDLGIDEVIEP
jgi:Glycosyl hydrolases family 2, TIM barrel domain/Glycosyl hydrolases family 2/Glycosyl hydrolases family 2, sugar binding domain